MSGLSFVVQGTFFNAPEFGTLDVIDNGAIAVSENGEILDVLHSNADGYETLVANARDSGTLHVLGEDEYLVPGLVDLHIHAPQWPQLGKALDEPLEVWLQKYTFPLEAKYSDHAFAHEVYDDLVQTLLAHGTTTAVYFGTVDYQANIILAESCLRHGQRALVGKVAMDDPAECPDFYRDESAESAIADTKRFIEKVREMQDGRNQLVWPTITPRFIPSCTDELLSGLGKLAQETGCHVQTHCSESDWEVAFVENRCGSTDAVALDGYGLLTDKTVLAHCNFINQSDMKLMSKIGAAAAHCPLSNAYFSDAVFPVRRAKEHDVEIGLGTDISGGFSASIFDNIRYALMASRLASDGTEPDLPREKRGSGEEPLNATEVFHLATAGGGEAVSLPVGLLKKGYRFDALKVRANMPGSSFKTKKSIDSLVNIFEKLVLTAEFSCIKSVWVDGVRRDKDTD